MTNPYRISAWGRAGWATALVSLPVIATTAVFGLTDDRIVEHQGSKLAEQYTEQTETVDYGSAEETPDFPTRYGVPGRATTLVLYDAASEYAEDAEMYAIAAANLATHFGEVQIMEMAEYTAGAMDRYDAVIYLGTDEKVTPSPAFLLDVREGAKPVMWAEQNIDDLAKVAGPEGTDFVSQYGWNPENPVTVDSEPVQNARYKERVVQRNTLSSEDVDLPRIVDPAAVEVLASGICGDDPASPVPCETDDPAIRDTELPWIVRSGNLTYLSELPLNYTDENEMYLVFADLYYDLLAADTPAVRQAAVRFEDVGPEADPEDLRRVADYLHSKGIPFQVAVVPTQIDRAPDGEGWYGLSLLDSPDVVEALKYMQSRGGTLIQHGTTHQYGNLNNPYSGRSGEDYEFYQYGCSATDLPPYEWEECEVDSYVRKIGPVAEDSVSEHMTRMDHGRQIMIDAGLGEPKIFETPHYTGSVNAYTAMAQKYEARYEQVEYFAGMISDKEITPGFVYGQFFPYKVKDIYGSTVYPENLENITEREQNNHAIRTPQTLINRAEANLVVRESTASFFFHPYLNIDYLKETVEGIEKLGYEFVPVTELI
ncbi:DUF2334 domain-containing protein [Kocuria rosea]|uniref:DUF2334 domain-containing protein n=1 Tax=Kocuria rosea TaxID=1275 RepID=UPI00203F8AE0|nr:polysaccharide deacetylase family protein [Kocuria rosea]MCM3687844.1 polysaccharide deacetylase family protein [Kocuria rosea]